MDMQSYILVQIYFYIVLESKAEKYLDTKKKFENITKKITEKEMLLYKCYILKCGHKN